MRQTVLFLALFTAAFALRFFLLSSVPAALTEREITLGLWAFFPNQNLVNLQLLTPFSAFFITPFIKFFGLNPLAIRLPSVLLGSLTVVIFYFFVNQINFYLVKKYKLKEILLLPLIATVFFVISPWHIQISRIDTPTNLGLFSFLLGSTLLLKFGSKKNYLFLLFIPFLFAIYADYSFFIPTIFVAILVLFFSQKESKKQLLKTIVHLAIIFLLLIPVFSQLKQYVFHIENVQGYLLIEKGKLSENRISYSMNTPLSQILYIKPVEAAKLNLQNIFSYLEPKQLFISWTLNPSIISPFNGFFYITDLLFLIFGILFLIKQNRFLLILFITWIAVIIIPSSLVSNTPDPLSTILILPPTLIAITYGFFEVKYLLRNKPRQILFFFLFGIIVFCVTKFLVTYFIAYPKTSIDYAQGYQQAFAFLNHSSANVMVTDATYNKNAFLYWIFEEKKMPIPKKRKADNIIKQFESYTFLSQTPSFYQKDTIYIQPTDSMPEKTNILFQNKTMDKKYQITVFTIN